MACTKIGQVGEGNTGEETIFGQVFFPAIPAHFMSPIKFKLPIPEKPAPVSKWQNPEGTTKYRAFSPP